MPLHLSLSPITTALRHRPLIPVTVAYAVGLLGSSSPAGFAVAVAAVCVLSVIAARARSPFTVILVCFVGLGLARGYLAGRPDPSDVSRLSGQGYVTLHGSVSGDVDLRAEYASTELAVERCELPDGRVLACSGRVVARVSGGSVSPEFGDRIAARGRLEPIDAPRNPGAFDYQAYMARRGVYAALHVRRASDWKPEPDSSRSSGIGDLVHRAKASLVGALHSTLHAVEADLASGILIGERTRIPAGLSEDFTVTGTAHILATAGLHVGLVAALILGGLRLLRMPRKPAAAITVLALILYALVAGGRPSVVRASLMAGALLIGYCFDREPDGPNTLAAAAFAILIVAPLSLFDIGFQLSFATVGTILAVMMVARPWLDRIRTRRNSPASRSKNVAAALRHYTAVLLTLSTAAQLGSAPLVAEYFNQVSFVGIAANALIVPVLIVVLGSGFAVWGLSLVWPASAKFVAAVVLSPLLAYVIGAARLSADVPSAVVYVPSPGWTAISLYYALLGAALYGIHVRTRRPTAHVAVAVVAEQEACEVA